MDLKTQKQEHDAQITRTILGLEETDPFMADILKRVANKEHPYGIHKIRGLTCFDHRGNVINPRPRIPGRNEKCPCGSGKKYKKCCIKEYHT